ncbi:hypothetical protein PIB30_096455 [Stylosanthes scabra]|uniref:Uncharacterized protein n=1 Tax=Stylosanthes scabra TaxID=79078 RepID=A0ABU6VZP3_9FABA|nr:hypothetical protein [Stylosanthes scabra]
MRAEDIIAENLVVIAQGLPNKGNLSFPSTIYKLCKDAGVPLREFRRTPRIPKVSYIMAKRRESTRIPRNLPQPQQEDDDEDERMPQAGGGNDEEEEQQQPQQNQQPPQQGFPDFQPQYESQYHETLQGIESHLSSMQFFQQIFYENMEKSQADYMEEVKQIKAKQEEIWTNNQRFQSQFRQEQERLAKEIQEQGRHTLVGLTNKQIRNLSETDLMHTNAKKGRPMFYGCLKSVYGASTSSQADPQEPVPLWTVPPIPSFQPPHPPQRKLEEQEEELEHSGQSLHAQRLGVQDLTLGSSHPRLGTDANA